MLLAHFQLGTIPSKFFSAGKNVYKDIYIPVGEAGKMQSLKTEIHSSSLLVFFLFSFFKIIIIIHI